MKAVIQTGYGLPEEVLTLQEIDKPEVGDDDVLVKVRATSVHADVWHVVTGVPYILRLMGAGLFKPKVSVPGTDLAGLVEAVGKNVDRFQPGDAVFGESQSVMQWNNGGAFAEYAAVPHDGLALKPEKVTFEQAASVATAGYIVLMNLRENAEIQPGHDVLINGAGGGVGSIALQVAKARGARVTGVDGAEKLEMIRTLGADRVIDYRQEDFTQRDERYDLIFDVASTLSLKCSKRVLKRDGVYVLIGHDHYGTVGRRVFGSLPRMFVQMARTPFDRHLPKLNFSFPKKSAVMDELRDLLESGELTPVVGETFPLEQVREARRCLQEGRNRGKIVLNMDLP